MCRASETINQELSEWVSALVEVALQGRDLKEVISTEEMLAHIDRLNKAWETTGFNPDTEDVFCWILRC